MNRLLGSTFFTIEVSLAPPTVVEGAPPLHERDLDVNPARIEVDRPGRHALGFIELGRPAHDCGRSLVLRRPTQIELPRADQRSPLFERDGPRRVRFATGR